ncbi:DNA polymerase [Cryptosporangium aurantiacum]|uniref:DNA polymerase I n=1 Tax=Cryptosporangium aurantiacum TaxID=134849 RepID=A0A1M7RPA5_9ACTN|nr:DNA polymerase [Cryptosporangium aurantiacum]SHN48187.1 DNA polymerase-1 [Cryptosporangium aurantiacum]
MTTITRRHVGHTMTVHAPRAGTGEFDPAAFRADLDHVVLGLDVETRAIVEDSPGHFGPDAGLRLVQLATSDTAYVLDPADPHQRAALVETLTDQRRHFVTHTNYDVLAVWSAFGISLGQRVLDAHLLSKLLDPDERAGHGLKDLSDRFLDDGLSRAEKALHQRMWRLAPSVVRAAGDTSVGRWGWDHIPVDDPDYVTYAGLDAIYVRRLLPKLLYRCASFAHLVPVEHWLATQSTGITIRGLLLDVDYTRRALAAASAAQNRADAEIRRALGCSATSPRFADWLDGQGVQGPRTEGGQLQVTGDTLTALMADLEAGRQRLSPAAAALVEARYRVSKSSNITSNLRSFLAHADDDGRVHPQINTMRAHTARMSITHPALQTLKKGNGLRHCFRADPGHVLIGCDFSQVEVRVAAALSRDTNLMTVIASGLKLHNETAKLMFGDPFTEAQYKLAKIATFLTQYGGGAEALASQTGVDDATAAEVIRLWKAAYPGVGAYGKRLGRCDTVVTGSGRRVPGNPARRYANANYAIQSTARDLLVAAVHTLVTREGLDPAALWLFVHDEVIVQAPADQAEKVRDLVHQTMTTAFRGVPIAAEAEIVGTHWGEAGELAPATATPAVAA